jgi:hypothetical protein
MKILNSKWKYLLLVPIVFLAMSGIYFRHAAKEIQNALLGEKYKEAIDIVDILAAAVEANTERQWQDHEQNIVASVEYTDRLYQVYAEAYKPIDGELVSITERFYETSPFAPFEFAEFIEMAAAKESGSLVIGYTPDDQDYRGLHLYFRWMPLYSPPDERYLVIVGISRYSVVSTVPLWVSAAQWASMGLTFAINVSLILLLARLGYIYDLRHGNKWRKEDGDDDV